MIDYQRLGCFHRLQLTAIKFNDGYRPSVAVGPPLGHRRHVAVGPPLGHRRWTQLKRGWPDGGPTATIAIARHAHTRRWANGYRLSVAVGPPLGHRRHVAVGPPLGHRRWAQLKRGWPDGGPTATIAIARHAHTRRWANGYRLSRW